MAFDDIGISTRANNEAPEHSENHDQLVVVLFDDTTQAEEMNKALEGLVESKVLHLSDVVIVSRNAEGELEVNQTVHNEKRSGTTKGAVFGTIIGVIVGGPVLGLAGGAAIGRWIGKHTDLGIDNATIESISNALNNGQSALFAMGSAKMPGPVKEVFSKFDGTIVQTTLDTEATEQLQKALDSDS